MLVAVQQGSVSLEAITDIAPPEVQTKLNAARQRGGNTPAHVLFDAILRNEVPAEQRGGSNDAAKVNALLRQMRDRKKRKSRKHAALPFAYL
jgi:hypothetical protein